MTTRWIEQNYRRVRARTFGQLIRGASLRVWPMSHIVHKHYRTRMAPENWNRINARALELHDRQRPELDDTQAAVLKALNTDGVYTSPATAFTGTDAVLGRAREDANALLSQPHVQRQISARNSKEGVKWYVVRAFGYKPRQHVPDSFADILLNDRILGVVNSYLGVTSRLKYLDVWHNFAVSSSDPPIDSEMWHRDNEDRKLIKVFIHLSDVDDAAGPLTYLRGSQPGGPLGDLFPNDPPTGSYPPENELQPWVSDSSIRACTGDAGTLVMFDACGLHHGGRATGKARTMLVATYASDAALDLLKYELEDPGRLDSMSPQARYALHAPVD